MPKIARLADKVADAAQSARISEKGAQLLSQVSNTKLKNSVKEIYRPGAKIGDGGLSDAIRHEIRTKELVGGKSHIQKGVERLKNLERILSKENLTEQEITIVKNLISDLKLALGGK